MDQAPDIELWDYAQDRDFVIVSKDADYNELSAVRGFPSRRDLDL